MNTPPNHEAHIFCHGIGKFHSPNNAKDPQPLQLITREEIIRMVDEPCAVQKSEAPWIIPSSYQSRSHKEQAQNGIYWALWFDFDRDPPNSQAIFNVLREWTHDGCCDFEVYTTRSATGDNRKLRLLVWLERGLTPGVWQLSQRVGNQKFAEAGIQTDPANEGVGQLCYLPNRGEYWGSRSQRDGLFFDPTLAWADELDTLDEADQIQREQDEQARLERLRQRELKRSAIGGALEKPSAIDAFNQIYSVEDVLLENGYDQNGSDFRHPASESGNYSASVKDGRVYSLSPADPLWNADGHAHDPISAMAAIRFGGDQSAAVKFISHELLHVDGRSWDEWSRENWKDERRARQKAESQKIGDQGLDPEEPLAQRITLEESLNRFVFLEDGSRVGDLLRPRWSVALTDFRNIFSGSLEQLPNGGEVPVSRLWLQDERRLTRHAQTFKAGAGRFCRDPEGRECLNSWTPIERLGPIGDAGPLVSHIRWLFGERSDDFLDWLAHVEQKPAELPHTSWIHIGRHTGLGRNLISSFLARLWPGQCATNFDLSAALGRGFNGRLAGKILAQVDEIREGGGLQRWAHHEKLKSLVNCEIREVNPKYGRGSLEWNSCRWLIFSNSEAAIPVEQHDRRFEVVICRDEPRSADYYKTLYGMLADPGVVNGLWDFLAKRDISGFNPGRRAKDTLDKKTLRDSAMSEFDRVAVDVVNGWPSDLVTNDVLTRIFVGQLAIRDQEKGLQAGHRAALQDAGAQPGRDRIRVGKPTRYWILRDHDRWQNATVEAKRLEILRGNPSDSVDPRTCF